MSELYRDYIDGKADEIINSLGGTITPAPANAELYRDFLDRKFDDVINAIDDNVKVKSFTYTGGGTNPNVIEFPTIPKRVLRIEGYNANDHSAWSNLQGFIWGNSKGTFFYQIPFNLGSVTFRSIALSFNDNELTLTGGSTTQVMDTNGITYTVYYI